MKDTTGIGSVTEGMVLSALLRKGKKILLPFNGASRYDLLVDEGNSFVRIQCKTGRIRQGCVQFRNYSMTGAGMKKYTKEEVDIFGVYCPDNDTVYLVPIEQCGKQATKLRVDPPKSRQFKKIRFAKDFEF